MLTPFRRRDGFAEGACQKLGYIAARLVYALTLLVGTTLAVFILFQIVPSDPARIALGANASVAQVANLRAELGLDQPAPVRMKRYLVGLAQGDWGRSFGDGRPVLNEVFGRLAITGVLASLASALAFLYVATQLGTRRPGRSHRPFRVANFAMTSLPTMFIGILVIVGIRNFYPFNYFSGSLSEPSDWAAMLPPALVLAFYPMGILGRISDELMREIDTAGYIIAARARGVNEQTILWRHAMPNMLVPLLAAFGTQLPMLLTSTFVVEIMFSVPGIGALLLKAVLERDLPMLQGIVLATTGVVLSINLTLEMLYPLIDPRIRTPVP